MTDVVDMADAVALGDVLLLILIVLLILVTLLIIPMLVPLSIRGESPIVMILGAGTLMLGGEIPLLGVGMMRLEMAVASEPEWVTAFVESELICLEVKLAELWAAIGANVPFTAPTDCTVPSETGTLFR